MKLHVRQFFQFSIVLSLSLFCATGCSIHVPTTQTPDLATSQLLSPEESNQPTVSFTPTSTEHSRTATPTPLATLTPRPPTSTRSPTLSANDAKLEVLDLLNDNGGCQLPCLWGMIPGQTQPRELINSLARFGRISTSNVVIDPANFGDKGGIIIVLKEKNLKTSINFSYYYETTNKLDQLTLSGIALREIGTDSNFEQVFGDPYFNQLFQNYMLPEILVLYGRPSQVLIKPFPDDPDYPAPLWHLFSIVLYYHEQGFLVDYVSPRESVGDHFVGCPSKAQLKITSWPPEDSLSIAEVVLRFSGQGIQTGNVDSYKPIDEVTSMTLDEFYQVFQNPENTACIETPMNLWSKL